MAEARSAVTEPRVRKLDEGRSPQQDFLVAWRKSFVRRFFRTRNSIRNGLWPTSIWNLGVLVAILSLLTIADPEFARPITSCLHSIQLYICIPERCPTLLSALVVSFVTGLVFFTILMYVRRFALRALLSYRGWMYEQPRTQSASTLVWAILVRLVSGYSPKLYSCQQSLPRMAVPPLKDTLRKLLESLKPLYGEDSDKLKELEKEAQEFEKTLGPKLQRVLVLRSWWAQNWVSDWWEKYVYLMGRSPLPINSNYYIMDQGYWTPTQRQVSRAASEIYQLLTVRQLIDREQLEPLVIRGTIPLCMAQYERAFSTTRIPGEDQDTLQHYDSRESRHIVVLRKGIMYKVRVYDDAGKLTTPRHLEKQLQWIMEDAELHQDDHSDAQKSICALTGLDRTTWAKVRNQFFCDGINKESIETIDKAVLLLVLDTNKFDEFSSRGKYLLHGDGKSIWFDKCINLIVFTDGRSGVNCEHSYADAPVIGHCLEYNFTHETSLFCKDQGYYLALFDEDGHCCPMKEDLETAVSNDIPSRLEWDTSHFVSQIENALVFHNKNSEDLQLCVRDHDIYGKDFIKTCKVSPDAYIQMILQITYYKNAGKHALTYESSMTRLYLSGRTETVRSLTSESAEFVTAFLSKSVSREEKIRLMRRACDKHQNLYRHSMCGKGIDRHLFALYVVSKGLEYDCDFLKKALSIPWTLSTSQQPQQQIASSPDCCLPQFKDMLCPGGGFGPVSDDGYGVSYMIAGNHKIFFHISAKNSVKETDAERFMDQLFETMAEVRELFVTENGL